MDDASRSGVCRVLGTDQVSPLRKVVQDGLIDGPRGGRIWSLRLECGHTEWRAQPASKTCLQRYARCELCGLGYDRDLSQE